MWEIEFYEKVNGRCPVKEFIDKLSPRADQPYIALAFDRLAQYGNKLDRPHVAYLRDDIYELRVKTRNGQFRFFYFYFNGQKIVITHGYQKKTSKIADPEIDKASDYRRDYFERH